MKPNLKPVPKEPPPPLTPLEQTRRAFLKATRHLQDAGKRRLRFASPIRASERERCGRGHIKGPFVRQAIAAESR
jgi:hypothetical protein